MSDRMSNFMSNRMSKCMSDRMSKLMSDRMSKFMSDRRLFGKLEVYVRIFALNAMVGISRSKVIFSRLLHKSKA